MASNLNSEFNYRYQVIGNTPWEKLKTCLLYTSDAADE